MSGEQPSEPLTFETAPTAVGKLSALASPNQLTPELVEAGFAEYDPGAPDAHFVAELLLDAATIGFALNAGGDVWPSHVRRAMQIHIELFNTAGQQG